MRTSLPILLSVAATVALAGRALAQNDECIGAISVAQGPNGPYSNAGATTSNPAWACGTGGNDLWYVYVAPGAGPLTVDLCGSSFDTVLELFQGNLGCGSLTPIGCNDDSCGLQSSLSTTVNAGDTIYIRAGGYNSATGSFSVNINGPAGTGTIATSTAFGRGCYVRYASFYESFATSALFDLSNTALSMLPTGSGAYTVIPGITTFVTPSASASVLTLGDDAEAIATLSLPFPYDGGVTSGLAVCSNGYVSVATGNGVGYSPVVSTFLNASQTGWWCWHDMNPSIVGSGQVKFEEIGGIAYITYDGVWDFLGTSSASANTFQFQFDCATGMVHVVFQTMSPAGNARLFGYSPGGSSMDPTSLDISAALVGSFQTVSPSAEGPGLTLGSVGRPVAGTTCTLGTSNIPAGTVIGATLLGFQQFNPGIDLSSFGLPGCFQFTSIQQPLIFIASGTTGSSPLAIPSSPSFHGMHLFAQSMTFSAGVNALGALTSNGLDLRIGNL